MLHTPSLLCFLLLCFPSLLSGAAHQGISPDTYLREGGRERALFFHSPSSLFLFFLNNFLGREVWGPAVIYMQNFVMFCLCER